MRSMLRRYTEHRARKYSVDRIRRWHYYCVYSKDLDILEIRVNEGYLAYIKELSRLKNTRGGSRQNRSYLGNKKNGLEASKRTY